MSSTSSSSTVPQPFSLMRSCLRSFPMRSCSPPGPARLNAMRSCRRGKPSAAGFPITPSSVSSLRAPLVEFPMRTPEFPRCLSLCTAMLLCCLVAHAQQPGSSASAGAMSDPEPPIAAPAPSSATTPADPATVPAANTATPPESLLIGPGDLLRITVLRESELDQRTRVLDSGEITLALAGNVPVQGLTPAAAAARIADKYRDGSFLLHPEVSVFIEEYATQSVTVLGQVVHPGTVHLAAPRSLIDV